MSDNLRAEIEQWAKDWSDENSFNPGMEGLGGLHAILDQDAIRTARPTPTPPLVDVIAEALMQQPYMQAIAALDENDAKQEAQAQACAVLDALTMTGPDTYTGKTTHLAHCTAVGISLPKEQP